MANKKVKADLQSKLVAKVNEVLAEVNEGAGKKIQKSLDAFAKKISKKFLKNIEKIERKAAKAEKGEKNVKVATPKAPKAKKVIPATVAAKTPTQENKPA